MTLVPYIYLLTLPVGPFVSASANIAKLEGLTSDLSATQCKEILNKTKQNQPDFKKVLYFKDIIRDLQDVIASFSKRRVPSRSWQRKFMIAAAQKQKELSKYFIKSMSKTIQ